MDLKKDAKKDDQNGEKIGEARGRKEAIQKIAREMISKNMKIEDIIDLTGLTKEEISSLN